MNEIMKLLAEIEKKFSVPWGYNLAGTMPGGGHFVGTGKGISANPEEWLAFRQKWERKAAAVG